MSTVTLPEPNWCTARKSHYLVLAAIAALTFVIYTVFGTYYTTHNAERLRAVITLQANGQAFLSAFPTWETDDEGDAAFYNRLALGIVHTGLPRNRTGSVSIYAPVYTYFLAACYYIGGLRLWSLALPQAALAALLAWCSGLAAGRLAPQYKPGVMWLAGALILVNLRLAASTAAIVPTLLLLPVFSLALYLAAGPLNRKSLLALSSIVVVAIFTQSAFFVVAFAIGVWLAWQFLAKRQAAFAVACLIVISGVAGMVVLRAAVARMGDSHRRENKVMLWESNNPYYESMTPTSLWGRRPGNPWGRWQPSAEEELRYNDYLKRGQTARIDPGLLWIVENPAQYLKLCWIRLYTTLGPFTGQMSPRNRLLSTFYWILIFPAGYYGLWRMRRLPITKMAVTVFLVLTAFESLVITEWYLRYRMPWELILTLYAAVGYMTIFTAVRKRSRTDGPQSRETIANTVT